MNIKAPFSSVISRISVYKAGSKQKRLAKTACIDGILRDNTISTEQKGQLIIQVNAL
jgi:hypothetical protein